MSSKMTKLDTASSEKWEQKKQRNVLKKPSDLPFISTVCHLVSAKYTSIKKRHSCFKLKLTGTAKRGKPINEVVISSAQPVLTTVEPQAATGKCKGLDSAQEKPPVHCETTEQVVSDAKNLMMSSKVKDANDAMADTIIVVVGPTKDTIQASLGTTQSAAINAFAEEDGVASAQQQQVYGNYPAHLGTGMTQFQQYAYQHFHSMVRGAGQTIWEALQTSYLNVLKRVASLPVVSTACDLAATAYTSTKESHPYVKSLCDMAEKGVTSLTSVAASTEQPVPPTLEPQEADSVPVASEEPEKVEENLPTIQQTAEKAMSDAQEMVSSRLTDVKESMIRVVDLTKEAMQDGMKTTRSVVAEGMSTIADSRMGQLAISGMEAVLEKSEALLDHYLPMTEDELAELAEPVEGAEVSAAQPQEHRSYFVRLGSLSTKLRQRAYCYSLDKMRRTSHSISEALSQLQQTMGLIEHSKQGVTLQDVQEKFQHMWLNWKQPKGSEIRDLANPEMESETLAMSRSILQQLQDACRVLVLSIQGLPANFQDKVQQVSRNVGELHASFSTARSFQDLSSSLLTQSQEMVTKAQEYVDELMAYVMQNTPLSWIVGPFVPLRKGSDSLEPQIQETEAKAKEVEIVAASKTDKEDL
ncbi:perilipin-3-like [Pelodiscus sinensis]|uniref:perilipin-3-like n=1 Tax=Pelodiscus sinensis TaxID=13735 RepID=UPI003F6C9F1C